jgi:hypothetical protein
MRAESNGLGVETIHCGMRAVANSPREPPVAQTAASGASHLGQLNPISAGTLTIRAWRGRLLASLVPVCRPPWGDRRLSAPVLRALRPSIYGASFVSSSFSL